MGNKSTSCCENTITGTCPTQPQIQCTDTFTNDCDGINKICTKFIQTDISASRPGTCSATQPCCIPSSTGYPNLDGQGAWLYDDPNSTCPAQADCINVNTARCILLGDQGDVCAGESGGNISTNRSRSIPVTCKWDANKFKDINVVKGWVSQFDQSDPEVKKVFDSQIMPTLCSVPQTDACPASNIDGAWVGNVCSPYVATNETGSFCRSWLSGLSNDSDTVEAVNSKSIVGYCEFLAKEAQNNPSAGLKGGEVNECLCINRGKDPSGPFDQTRDALSSGGGSDLNNNNNGVNELGQVGCWYTPCNSDTTQLVPLKDNTTQPIYYPTDCPNVCKIVNDIKGNITNTNITENINCPSTAPTPPNQGGSGSGSGGGGNGNGGTGTGTDPTNQETLWEKYKWLIIGGAALILVLIVFFIIFIVFEEEKKDK